MAQSNSAYFAVRAAEERRLSQTASDPRAAAVHQELAERYQRLSAEVSTEPWGLRLVRNVERPEVVAASWLALTRRPPKAKLDPNGRVGASQKAQHPS